MQKYLMSLVALLLLVLVLFPRHSRVEIQAPAVVMEVLDGSLEEYAPLWQAEIARRFPHAVGILVHGGDFVEGEWIVGANLADGRVTPIQDVVEHYRRLYPDRTIVVLACNPGHLKMNIPGVYYATASVWCVPDREMAEPRSENSLTLDGRWSTAPDVAGNIYEFVTE